MDMYKKRELRAIKKQNNDKNNIEKNNKPNINFYPGHMAKTKRLIKEKLELIDIVFEICDARIPVSSKIKDINDLIKNKKRILIFTKMDLCDYDRTKEYIDMYKKEGYEVIDVDLINMKNIDQITKITNKVLSDINKKREQKGLIKRKARALVIGIPNVGKSTLINRLVGKRSVNVGNKAGITKNISWIRINSELELLDTPGILWPKFDDQKIAYNLACTSSIKEEILPIEEVAIYILKHLNKNYKDLLIKRYGINDIDFDNIVETLDIIGKKRGCLISGGEIDYDKVYNLIIRDVKEGLIGKITFD